MSGKPGRWANINEAIHDADSSVVVYDSGLGKITFTIDDVEVGYFDSSGLTVSGGITGNINSISQLDSNVTVTDLGSGEITMDIDGVQLLKLHESSGEAHLNLGVDGDTFGRLGIYGDDGDEDGGTIRLYSALNETDIAYSQIRTYQQKLQIGTDVDQDAIEVESTSTASRFEVHLNDIQMDGKASAEVITLTVGQGGNRQGIVRIGGQSSPSKDGGELLFYLPDDYDNGAIASYRITIYEDDLHMGPSTDLDALKYDGANGKWIIDGQTNGVELLQGGSIKMKTSAVGINISDGAAAGADLGFSSDDFIIQNNDPAGQMYLYARNSADNLNNIVFHADPDGASRIYWAGLEKLATTATGVNTTGLQLNTGQSVDTIETTLTDDDTHLPTSGAVVDYVAAQFAANDAMVYKGAIDASTNPNYPAADAGHTYRISVAGKIGGASGDTVEVGDMIICISDGSLAGDQATVGTNWNNIQVNIDGYVIGPASSTDHAVARFDLATGKLIQGSSVTIDDSGSVNVPSGQSYKINNVALAASDVGAAPSSHGNANHSSTFITASGVTYGNLSANGDIGTGATQVSQGDHSHAQLHDRSHAITGTSDHTATAWRVFSSNGAGQIAEIALGADNTYFKSTGAAAAPGFEVLDISDDASPTLGGDLALDENSIKYVPGSLADTTSEGEVATMTVDSAAAVAFGDLLFMASDFELEQADASASATMPVIAMSLGTGEGSQDVLLRGFVRDDTWNWSAGPIYADIATGLMTQTAPSGSGEQVQRVGWAYSADIMFFDPNSTLVEVV